MINFIYFFKDPKMTDWLWEVKECKEQKERFLSERKDKELFYSEEEQTRRLAQKLKEVKL